MIAWIFTRAVAASFQWRGDSPEAAPAGEKHHVLLFLAGASYQPVLGHSDRADKSNRHA
jgi:hypothetical protein